MNLYFQKDISGFCYHFFPEKNRQAISGLCACFFKGEIQVSEKKKINFSFSIFFLFGYLRRYFKTILPFVSGTYKHRIGPDRTGSGSITGSDRIGPYFDYYFDFFFYFLVVIFNTVLVF